MNITGSLRHFPNKYFFPNKWSQILPSSSSTHMHYGRSMLPAGVYPRLEKDWWYFEWYLDCHKQTQCLFPSCTLQWERFWFFSPVETRQVFPKESNASGSLSELFTPFQVVFPMHLSRFFPVEPSESSQRSQRLVDHWTSFPNCTERDFPKRATEPARIPEPVLPVEPR